MTLQEFNEKFIYKTDKEKYGLEDYWEEPKPNKDGMYEADCESYAIFVKRNILGFHHWKYYYCKLNGEGHCVLINEADKIVLDNNVQSPTKLKEYKKWMKEHNVEVTGLRPYKWYELICNFNYAKILKLWLKFKRKRLTNGR